MRTVKTAVPAREYIMFKIENDAGKRMPARPPYSKSAFAPAHTIHLGWYVDVKSQSSSAHAKSTLADMS